jgi:hypothetical protein
MGESGSQVVDAGLLPIAAIDAEEKRGDEVDDQA